MKVCNPSEAARRVFEVTGVTRLLEGKRLRLPDADPAEPEERRYT